MPIPTKYQGPNYGVSYSDEEARQAIADAEIAQIVASESPPPGSSVTVTNFSGNAANILGNPNDLAAHFDDPANIIQLLKAISAVLGDVFPNQDSLSTIQEYISDISVNLTILLGNSIGNDFNPSAASDTATASLIALIKRLLSVKLPSALSNDRFKTNTVLADQGGNILSSVKSGGASAAASDTALVVQERPFISATILSLQTATTGTNFQAFASQACTRLDILNFSGVDVEYRRGGAGNTVRIPNNSGRLVVAIANANEISVRRVDQSNTQVTVQAEAIAS